MPPIEAGFPHLPERLKGLGELTDNLWWCWHPAARMLFKQINRRAWKESVHNPDKMLKELSPEYLRAASKNRSFLRHYDLVLSQFRKYRSAHGCQLLPSSYQKEPIAYFSAEYGLHHSLPFYAGGLGFLAGDFIKECSDLNVPMVAVGFMYPEGYVSQRIGTDGWQESIRFHIDREAASISQVVDGNGQPLLFKVPVIEPAIFITVWQVNVGRVPLYLLDTETEANEPWNRGISARLYTGDPEQRLRQEIVLGIGGAEVLRKMGITPSLVHLNEGHAAFALLERIRDQIDNGLSIEDAMERVRATTIFTTHTSVAAGQDVFPFGLVEKYCSQLWTSLGLDRETFLQLGTHPENPSGFNMTAFALRLAQYRNGVSKKHGEVANTMWANLWGHMSSETQSIASITNGVHVPTWIEPKMELLFNKYLGPDWLDQHDDHYLWELINEIPDEELWKTHMWLKIKLFDAIRDRTRKRWVEDGIDPSIAIAGGAFLDPSILTLGFARRFATYKRADLIFHDLDRLRVMLTDRWKPIQIIFAGKAHPEDNLGKIILQRIVNFAKNPQFSGRIAFVEDYGEQFAQYMVHGVDVWLNNPLPPMEACGTSGMKASLNGVPSLSILDGWWLEGYTGDNGWAFGGKPVEGDRTSADAAALYRILEGKVIPLYYDLDKNGLPHGWLRVMKNAIKSNGSRFSARRMVKEYVGKFYVEALQNISR